MKDNIDFIVFSINQAKEAEEYGFTRNECCRNLKTALHQYWQNKTLKQHGQSQKANLPRSKAAIGKLITELDVEHVIPQMVIVNVLMDQKLITKDKVEEILIKYFRVMLVTKDEHNRLNSTGLSSKMPTDWDGNNVWARYNAVGIEPEK